MRAFCTAWNRHDGHALAQLLSGRFNQSQLRSVQTAVRFLQPRIAIVHQPRYGMMTTVMQKRQGSWRVVASQNDNAVPGNRAAGRMPHLAMPIPGPPAP
jgi:hypothetical protein